MVEIESAEHVMEKIFETKSERLYLNARRSRGLRTNSNHDQKRPGKTHTTTAIVFIYHPMSAF